MVATLKLNIICNLFWIKPLNSISSERAVWIKQFIIAQGIPIIPIPAEVDLFQSPLRTNLYTTSPIIRQMTKPPIANLAHSFLLEEKFFKPIQEKKDCFFRAVKENNEPGTVNTNVIVEKA